MRSKYLILGPGARKSLSVTESYTTDTFNVLSRTLDKRLGIYGTIYNNITNKLAQKFSPSLFISHTLKILLNHTNKI